MNKLSRLIFGEKDENQSDDEYEAGKPLGIISWLFVIFCVSSLLKLIIDLLG